MCDLYVDEDKWIELMKSYGRNMTGIVTGSHVQKSAKTILKNKFSELGFPQDHIDNFKL